MRVISKAALVVNLVNDASAAEPKPSPVAVLTTPAFEHPAPRRPEIYAVMGIVPLWRFTGMLGVAFPRLLSLELLARFKNTRALRWDAFAVGVGIDYSPPGIARFGDGTTASWVQMGLEGKWFLWRGIFIGARVGWQLARGEDRDSRAHVTTSFVMAPKIGFIHTFGTARRTLGGVTIGADLGADLPMAPQRSDAAESTAEARRASDRFAATYWPTFALRLGYTISDRVR